VHDPAVLLDAGTARAQAEQALAAAPDREAGYFRVPPIVENVNP